MMNYDAIKINKALGAINDAILDLQRVVNNNRDPNMFLIRRASNTIIVDLHDIVTKLKHLMDEHL